MDNGRIGYIAACIAAPIAWALVVVWASNWIERFLSRRSKRRDGAHPSSPMPPIDYHI